MAGREQEALPDRAAKYAFLSLGLHCAAFFTAIREEERDTILRLILYLAYGLCLLAMDRILFRLKSPGALLFMRWYWAAASICMTCWLIWGEHWLSSTNDFLKLLLSCAIVPYCHIFLVSYQGWPWKNSGLASRWGTASLLLLCLAHLVYYCWLSWRKKRPESRAGG